MSTGATVLAVREAVTVREHGTVRHVDQLSDEARAGLASLREGERQPVDGLEPGEVVKTTSYLRVVSVQTAEATALANRESVTADTTALATP